MSLLLRSRHLSHVGEEARRVQFHPLILLVGELLAAEGLYQGGCVAFLVGAEAGEEKSDGKRRERHWFVELRLGLGLCWSRGEVVCPSFCFFSPSFSESARNDFGLVDHYRILLSLISRVSIHDKESLVRTGPTGVGTDVSGIFAAVFLEELGFVVVEGEGICKLVIYAYIYMKKYSLITLTSSSSSVPMSVTVTGSETITLLKRLEILVIVTVSAPVASLTTFAK